MIFNGYIILDGYIVIYVKDGVIIVVNGILSVDKVKIIGIIKVIVFIDG